MSNLLSSIFLFELILPVCIFLGLRVRQILFYTDVSAALEVEFGSRGMFSDILFLYKNVCIDMNLKSLKNILKEMLH